MKRNMVQGMKRNMVQGAIAEHGSRSEAEHGSRSSRTVVEVNSEILFIHCTQIFHHTINPIINLIIIHHQ
jgi:hypothetical protein